MLTDILLSTELKIVGRTGIWSVHGNNYAVFVSLRSAATSADSDGVSSAGHGAESDYFRTAADLSDELQLFIELDVQ